MPSIQLFDPATRAYTYLVTDATTHEALIIDPVAERLPRDQAMLLHEQLKLTWIVETHVHEDHVSGAALLAADTGARIAVPAASGIQGAQRELNDGETLAVGSEVLRVIATPGHSAEAICLLHEPADGIHPPDLYTGDTLLIGGCGRIDLPTSDAGTLYDSVAAKLFALPLATRVWPGHDWHERGQSTLALERATNADVVGRSRAEFVAWMAARSWPALPDMERTLAANRRCGAPDKAEQAMGPE